MDGNLIAQAPNSTAPASGNYNNITFTPAGSQSIAYSGTTATITVLTANAIGTGNITSSTYLYARIGLLTTSANAIGTISAAFGTS